MSFFNELKRRNVFRIGIVYAITAWLIAQIAGLAADSFDAPAWVMKMIITMLMLGAPLALVMAWAYELTPSGLRRESDIEQGQSSAQANASKLNRTITFALVLAVAYFSYDKFVLDPRRDTVLLESASQQHARSNLQVDIAGDESPSVDQAPSIAVLPFVNMSADSDNEYFSDGLSEELLNLLGRIPELKVAARTSSFSYRGKDTKIGQIGEELGVAHVLEGSVRKSGDHVRITAQLIKADDGYQLWSQTYNRTLEDIFVTQDEIAKSVVDNLKVNLLGTMPEVSKTDTETYSLYLQGTYFIRLGGVENLEKAVATLKQALAIDPNYAQAWVGLDWAYDSLTYANPAAREKYRTPRLEAIKRALAIDENYAYAWAALAYQRTFYDSDWLGARIAIEKALRLEPNNSDVIGAVAWIASSLGQLPESIELYEKAIRLDPLQLDYMIELGLRYLRVGRIDDAFAAIDRVRAINPDHARLNNAFSRVYIMRGDFENAMLEIEKEPDSFFYRHEKAHILYMMGRETEAQALINELLETSADDVPGAMAVLYAWNGDGDSAFEWKEIAYEQDGDRPDAFLGTLYWRKLTGDPRYSAFVEKYGLLEEWKAMPPEYGGPPTQ